MEYKGYMIVGDGTFGMKMIKKPGQGGTIPKMLEGAYSSVINAKKAIDIYATIKEEIASKPAPIKKVKLTPREVANGTESESGD